MEKIKKYGILIILALAFCLRIYQVHSPLIGHHSWRQTTTASLARNYYENGYHFFYPQIDWGGDTPGYVESEFPLYPFAVALFYTIGGVSESWGRLLSIFCSLTTIYFFYLLVIKMMDQETAMWSSFFLSILPLSVFFSRTFMPDAALLMSSVVGLYFFSEWLNSNKWRHFFLSALFVSLAGLLKIPALCLGLPLLYLAWMKLGRRVFWSWTLGLYGLLVLIPVGCWYYHAHQIYLHSGLTFGIWEYGVDKWGNWDLTFSLKFWERILINSLAEDHFTWAGFPLFLTGFIVRRRKQEERFFDWWLIAVVIYFAIVSKGNYVHNYYQLPFLLPATVFMGKAMTRFFVPNKFLTVKNVLMIIWILGIIGWSLGRYCSLVLEDYVNYSEELILAEQVDKKVEKKALIVAVDKGDPTILYLSHRKGWHAHPDTLFIPFLQEREKLGARYLIGIYKYFDSKTGHENLLRLLRNYPIVHNNGKSFIIKLS